MSEEVTGLTGHLFRSCCHFYTRGHFVEGVKKIDALGENLSLGALHPMTHELQFISGGHKIAAQQVGGQTPAHLARSANDRYVHSGSYPTPVDGVSLGCNGLSHDVPHYRKL